MALNGRRSEAEALLLKHLTESPGDTDARTLYGTVLSWDGNYQEARRQLEKVLVDSPGNGDALQALANVELWTDHPAKAEELLAPVLRERPNDTDVLYAGARALIALNRQPEAAKLLRHLLDVDPGNKDARRLFDGLGNEALLYEVSLEEYYERYSDRIGDRFESQLALKRQMHLGSLIGRYDYAHGFGLNSNQMEVDFYPAIRKGTYAYLNVGFSPDHNLYPQYRLGSDIFQTLTHGFEGTIGYRRLGFSTKVNIYTTALSKYYGNWLFTGRGYFTPDVIGTSESFHLIARRYFHDANTYVQFRFGRGATPAEINNVIDIFVLNSTVYDATFHVGLSRHWFWDSEFGFSREDRLNRPLVNHYSANLGASYRF